MKKTILLFAVTAIYCAVCPAAEAFSYKTMGDLYRKGDFTSLETTAKNMLSTNIKDQEKASCCCNIVCARIKLKKYANKEAAYADLIALAKECNLSTTSNAYTRILMSVCYLLNDNTKAIEVSEGSKDGRILMRRGIAFSALKRYNEAYQAYKQAANLIKYKPMKQLCFKYALSMAKLANLNVEIFNMINEAVSNNAIDDPELLKKYVEIIISANFNETTVTAANIKDLLQNINRKYSRKLVAGSPSKWDELIVLVRQTLETY